MNLKNVISITTLIVLASAAFAGEEMQTKMKIAIVDGTDDGVVRVELDSDELGFNLHDMQVGENQSIVDATGRSILVTRETDGFSFNVDGKTIKVPAFAGDHDAVWVEKVDGDADVDVHLLHSDADTHDGHKVKIIKKKIEIKSDGPEA